MQLKISAIALFLFLAVSFALTDEGSTSMSGSFVTLTQQDGTKLRLFVAGPEDAPAGALIVHDYFGISDATKQAVEHFAALGYRAAAVDLYKGQSATDHEHALMLMQSLDRSATNCALQTGLDYLKRPGRKIATIGFSMGGQESLNANLNDPDGVSATAIVYGSGFDKISEARLATLKSPVLVITGADDIAAVQAGLEFLPIMRQAKQFYELFVYPAADHGYAQPLFNGGKNYNPEAVRVTWLLIDDFLALHLNR
jgi:carboxymethylenebutenolidase